MKLDKELEEKVAQLKEMKVKGFLSQKEFESMMEGLQMEVEKDVKTKPGIAIPKAAKPDIKKPEIDESLTDTAEDIALKIQQLKDMRKRGLLTQEEYEEMREEVLRI